MYLHLEGPLLLQESFPKGTIQVLNLETGDIRDLPFRTGWRFVNSEMTFMIFARLYSMTENERVIELWNTDNWREIYSFLPNLGDDWWPSNNDIAFSPDSGMLAIGYHGQVLLWNIRPFTKP